MPPKSKAICAGLLVGAVASVLPLELLLLFIGGLAASLLWWSWAGKRRLLGLGAATAVVFLAAQAHTKHVDRTISHPLANSRPSVAALCAKDFTCTPKVAAAGAQQWPTLSSVQPTWRELDDALSSVALELDMGYCGNGASFLFGADPIGGRPDIVTLN